MASKVCSDCTHFSACAAWNVGSIVDMKACVNFDDAYKRDQFLADTQAHIAKMQLTIDFQNEKIKHLQERIKRFLEKDDTL